MFPQFFQRFSQLLSCFSAFLLSSFFPPVSPGKSGRPGVSPRSGVSVVVAHASGDAPSPVSFCCCGGRSSKIMLYFKKLKKISISY
jgi:hypothetical protein